MSLVFRATDELDGATVAVKVLAPNRSADPRALDRFAGEASAVVGVVHPKLVRIRGIGEAPVPYIVMDLVDGEDLATRLARQGTLPPAEVGRCIREIADAAAALHARGLVHRDIKPGNILMGRDGTVRLGDYGLLRAHDATRVTDAGIVVGTLGYLAPEVLRGATPTPAADVYALAAVAYLALTGRLPRDASDIAGLVDSHASPVPAPSSVAPIPLPVAVDAILLTALDEAPGRPPAGTLGRELAAALAGVPIPVLSPSPSTAAVDPVRHGAVAPPAVAIPPGRHRRRLAALAASGALAVLAAVAMSGVPSSPTQDGDGGDRQAAVSGPTPAGPTPSPDAPRSASDGTRAEVQPGSGGTERAAVTVRAPEPPADGGTQAGARTTGGDGAEGHRDGEGQGERRDGESEQRAEREKDRRERAEERREREEEQREERREREEEQREEREDDDRGGDGDGGGRGGGDRG